MLVDLARSCASSLCNRSFSALSSRITASTSSSLDALEPAAPVVVDAIVLALRDLPEHARCSNIIFSICY